MGISSTVSQVKYTGDNTTYIFNAVKINLATDLIVQVKTGSTVTTLVNVTDYVVSSITTSVAIVTLVRNSQAWLSANVGLLSTYSLYITRVVPLTQLSDLRNQGAYYPETIESELDTLAMADQQISLRADKSIHLPTEVLSSEFSTTLPTAIVGSANKAILTNPTGTGLVLGDLTSTVMPFQAKGDLVMGGDFGAPTRFPWFPEPGAVLTQYLSNPTYAEWLQPPISSRAINNAYLRVDVAANTITFNLMDSVQSASPSSDDFVRSVFRSSTITSGLVNPVTISSATQLVVSNGSTLGQVSTKPWCIWVYLVFDSGTSTTQIGVSGTLYTENQLITTTAEGGAGGADSVSLLYTTTARTNATIRVIGKVTNTQATAGTWLTAPSKIEFGTYESLLDKKITTQSKTSTGLTTYYTPAGCTKIRVKMCGGGGGGASSGTASWGAATAGASSTWAISGGAILVTADGGGAGSNTGGGGTGGPAAVNAEYGASIPGNAGGGSGYNGVALQYASTGWGGQTPFFTGGGSAGSAGAVGTAGRANSGGGGGGGNAGSAINSYSGGGGGSGGFVEFTINNPSPSYDMTVGTGGNGGTAGTSGIAGGAGGSGVIFIEEFYN